MLGQGKPLGTWGCVSVRNEGRTSSFGVFELWDRGVVCGKQRRKLGCAGRPVHALSSGVKVRVQNDVTDARIQSMRIFVASRKLKKKKRNTDFDLIEHKR